MSAIPASTVSMKTMADGTLRISFDVEPSQAQDAFKLFAAPGTQVAIAALKDGSFLAQPKADMGIPITELKPREQLGDACYRTVMWCKESQFWDWVESQDFDGLGWPCRSEQQANTFVNWRCAVSSRKELDTNPEANKTWHREIRQPYADYLKRMEAAQ